MLIRIFLSTIGITAAAVFGLPGFANGQEAPRAVPEVIPAPAPSPAADPGSARAPRAVRVPGAHDSLEAGRDAHAMAERGRRRAIDRQLQTIEDIPWYNAWYDAWGRPYARRYALPYIYAYAPPYAAYRAHRAIEGYVPAPPYGMWLYDPGDGYGYPYVPRSYAPRVEQPLGHEKIWTGPNSYVYRPRFAEPPSEASPPPAPPAVPARLPPPPPEPAGPREF
jgi:hypothetical protein